LFSGDKVGTSAGHISTSTHVLVGKGHVTAEGNTAELGSQILSNHELKRDSHSFAGFNRWEVLSTLDEDES